MEDFRHLFALSSSGCNTLTFWPMSLSTTSDTFAIITLDPGIVDMVSQKSPGTFNGDDVADAKGAGSLGPPLSATLQPSHLTYVCDSCKETVQTVCKDEHQDWHFAKDLQLQEDDGAHTPNGKAHVSSADRKRHLAQPGDLDANEPPQYAPPAFPPTRNQSSGSAPGHRPHTNQVIEAARIRARDEVHAHAYM